MAARTPASDRTPSPISAASVAPSAGAPHLMPMPPHLASCGVGGSLGVDGVGVGGGDDAVDIGGGGGGGAALPSPGPRPALLDCKGASLLRA